jgi:hypothetical protein
MADKIHLYENDSPNVVRAGALPLPKQYYFHCAGCGNDHAFTVGPTVAGWGDARWSFNGSFDRPTFSPSLLCNKDYPESRCHSVVTDGKIAYQGDCWHALKGQTVDLPDWE